MLVILSPAKTLNMDKAVTIIKYTEPIFCKEALEIMNELRNYSPPEMESLLKINSELAEFNFFNHLKWNKNHCLINSKQALLTFHGAVYQGLATADFNEEELLFAQNHLRILSALYGVLRPLDLIQPYRLEMGTKLSNSKGQDLYRYWKEKLTVYFGQELEKHADRTLVNLASQEYSSSIDIKKLHCSLITPTFKEYKKGSYKTVTIYAKRARGLMTRYLVKNALKNPEQLKNFDEEGYAFNEPLSTDMEWVFTR